MFNNATSVNFRGKEVKQIVRVKDGAILYQQQEEKLLLSVEFTFTGETLSGGNFSGTNMKIDYGDGTEIQTTNGTFDYTYEKDDTYIVKIYGVTSLGDQCFAYTNRITSVTIFDNVTSIGYDCFYNSFLTNVVLPSSITSLEEGCFSHCRYLTNIVLPPSITSLGGGCFHWCYSLTNITIPLNVTNIGDSCFRRCENLFEITLEWTTSSEIVEYNDTWTYDLPSFDHFLIPAGTTDLYIEKGYPSDLLIEDINEPIGIDIPVSVFFDDDNENENGNRPDEVTVRLFVDRTEMRSAILSEENNWSYTFTGLPEESSPSSSYVLTADPDSYYIPRVEREDNEFFVYEEYHPTTVSVKIRILFDDNENEHQVRPDIVYAMLSNGMEVTVDEEHEWERGIITTSVKNRQEVEYDWTITTPSLYLISSKEKVNDYTVFTLKYSGTLPSTGGNR